MGSYRNFILSFVVLGGLSFTNSYAEYEEDIISFEEFSETNEDEEDLDRETEAFEHKSPDQQSENEVPHNTHSAPKKQILTDKVTPELDEEDEEEVMVPKKQVIIKEKVQQDPELGEGDPRDSGYNKTIESFDEFVSTSDGDEQEGGATNTGENISRKKTKNSEGSPTNAAIDNPNSETKKYEMKELGAVEIIVLNKITAKSTTITLKKGESEYSGNIEIKLYKCIKNTDPYNQDNMAFLRVVENKLDDDPILIFQGWMLSSSNAISSFEHPVYEIFSKKCL